MGQERGFGDGRLTAAGVSFLALGLVPGVLVAQSQPPSLVALGIEDPPVIDGDLGDPCWQLSEVGTGFSQTSPHDGIPATEETEIRVAYTQSTLYIAVRALDRTPQAIIAKEMERDAVLQPDDSVLIVLDTFHDGRNAYSFQTNPNGARSDALITDEGRDINTEWDGVWKVAAHRTAQGWVAELAIPFSTLRFDPSLDTWGMNVRRLIRHKNEETHWAPLPREISNPTSSQYAVYRVSDAGDLTGLKGIAPSRQLDVKPFLSGGLTERPEPGVDDTDDEADLGLDVKWGVGRSLVFGLTYNTDFAEVEVDQQQVNLTRFDLFFPEKREFFLENAGIFEFGLPNRDEFEPVQMKIFFSRRIGLEDGLEVPIDWGGRLTGRVGGWNVGVMNVITEDTEGEDGAPVARTSHGVMRAKRNLGRRSGIGVIATHRDEQGSGINRVVGVDFDYKPSRKLDFAGFVAESGDDRSQGDEWAAGTSFGYRGRDLTASFEWSEVREGFEPGLGFQLRDNYERINPRIRYTPRFERWGIRGWFFEGVLDYFARSSVDGLESRVVELSPLGMRTTGDDVWRLALVSQTEHLFEPFAIRRGIVIPVGLYKFEGWDLGGRTNDKRPVSLRGRIANGEFYDGDRGSASLSLQVRGTRFFRATTSWNHNDVELPQGDFTTTVWGERLSVSFNPDVKLNAFFQYNNAAELVALNIRFNWIYKPGADLFVVYNQNWDAPTFNRREIRDRQIIFKFTYLWQR